MLFAHLQPPLIPTKNSRRFSNCFLSETDRQFSGLDVMVEQDNEPIVATADFRAARPPSSGRECGHGANS
jgi:hypothetical protein